MGIGL